MSQKHRVEGRIVFFTVKSLENEFEFILKAVMTVERKHCLLSSHKPLPKEKNQWNLRLSFLHHLERLKINRCLKPPGMIW